MAYTQNPEFTYDHTASIREDVLDYVAIMSPVTAPLTYQLGFGQALGQPDFGWEMDYVAAPVTNLATTGSSAFGGDVATRSAYPEGWEAQFPDQQARTKATNTTCIVERTVDVSATQRVSLQYGVGDEYGYKVDQKFLEVVEQFDYNLHFGVYNDGTTNIASPTSARMTHGIAPWMFYTGNATGVAAATDVTIAGSAIPRSASTVRTGFSSTWYETGSGALTRANFHANALEPAYMRGMQIEGAVAFCGAAQKRIISDFAFVYNSSTFDMPLNERNVNARDRFISEGIDVFDTNLGTVIFNLDRHLDTDTTYSLDTGLSPAETHTLDVNEFMFLLDLDYWNIRVLRGIGYTPLAKVGDADKALIVLEAGLEVLNPIGGIGITDIAA